MVLVKASKDSEAGVMPSEQLLTAMTKFNEELAGSGALLAGEGLHPSSRGVRIHFDAGKRNVTDGPFAETKELLAGFWLVQMKSLPECVEFFKRAPMLPGDCLEIRKVFEADDFGPALTPELRAAEDKLRAQVDKRS